MLLRRLLTLGLLVAVCGDNRPIHCESEDCTAVLPKPPPFVGLAYRAVPPPARQNIALLPMVAADNITWRRSASGQHSICVTFSGVFQWKM